MVQVELLSTKLCPPRMRSVQVVRQRLLTRLESGLERALTLISAPAGFGKTTLLTEWMTAPRASGQAFPPVAWLSLDEGDNDPIRFWRYVTAACQVAHPSIGLSALSLLHSPEAPALESVVTALINDLATMPQQLILVLEDYHLISSARIHKALSFLLEHLPDTLHIVIATRSDPPLPLASLRVRDAMIELRAADLRFSFEETVAFLNEVAGFQLSTGDIGRLEMHTEGWIAGLQLVALLLQERHDISQFLATFTGSHRHVTEYLLEEVFASQPEDIQQFLLQTSILSRLNGSLCDSVTGENNGESMLEDLERANLFITPLDEDQRWYRYHALFAEALRHYARRKLGQAAICTLYSRASAWYEQQGQIDDAIEASLNAQEFPRAAQLMERALADSSMLYAFTQQRWIEQLPQDLLYTHPLLCFNYAQILFFNLFATERRAAYLKPLETAEQLWRGEGNLPKVGTVYALRTLAALWSGQTAQVLEYAEQALQLLAPQDSMWRSVSLATSGAVHRQLGNARQAYPILTEAHRLSEQAGYMFAILPILNSLAEVLVQQGQLRKAAQLYQEVIERAGSLLTDSYEARMHLSAIHFEWNDQEMAETGLQQALAEGKQSKEGHSLTYGALLLARIQQAHGESAEAQKSMGQLLAQASHQRRPVSLEELQAYQAWWSLSAGEMETVLNWQQTLDIDAVPSYAREQTYLILARVLIAQGEPAKTLHLLERWQTYAQEQGRTGSVLAILVLRALAYYAQGEAQQAQQTLAQALVLAQPEGYTRLFLQEGVVIAALLRTVRSRVSEPALTAYIDTLLNAFEEVRTEPVTLRPLPASSALMEPLSQHEYRVLRLLVAGLSNPEIANELMISVNTVKTHVKNIYSKLNVSSRKEAREAASHLKLL